MGWIKRNLGFVISGALAVALLGTAGFFIYKGLARNSDASDKLNEIYNTLKTLAGQKPSPGNDKIDNTQIAKDQEKELRAWMAKAQPCFQAVPSIPASNISSKTYATALGSTIYQLTQEAKAANVTLPPQFFFSFDAQNNKLTMSAASLDPLAVQLGEVKAITEILFAARINGLVSIQRERVSDDDANGPQSDYLDQPPVTNDMDLPPRKTPLLSRQLMCSRPAASPPLVLRAIRRRMRRRVIRDVTACRCAGRFRCAVKRA